MTIIQSDFRTKTMKNAPRKRREKEPESSSASFLEQAEVCREQARDAAKLKRFRAAIGLFLTAANLCRHARKSAVTEQKIDHEVMELATQKLEQIDIEMATYSELARVSEKSR